MKNNFYPCDAENGNCPFGAEYSNDCDRYCGLGRDDDSYEDEYDYDGEDY